MNQANSSPSLYIYKKGEVFICCESTTFGLYATHWLSAKVQQPGVQPSKFIYTFTKVGSIAPETPVSECCVQIDSEQNAFKEGDMVVIVNSYSAK